jgi:hypothetical protein
MKKYWGSDKEMEKREIVKKFLGPAIPSIGNLLEVG